MIDGRSATRALRIHKLVGCDLQVVFALMLLALCATPFAFAQDDARDEQGIDETIDDSESEEWDAQDTGEEVPEGADEFAESEAEPDNDNFSDLSADAPAEEFVENAEAGREAEPPEDDFSDLTDETPAGEFVENATPDDESFAAEPVREVSPAPAPVPVPVQPPSPVVQAPTRAPNVGSGGFSDVSDLRNGIVIWYNSTKGVGMIKDTETNEEIHVGSGGLRVEVRVGDAVAFQIHAGGRGRTAVNVQHEGGGEFTK